MVTFHAVIAQQVLKVHKIIISYRSDSKYAAINFLYIQRLQISRRVIAIYAPTIYIAPCINVLDAFISITRASGMELGPGNQELFWPC